MGGGSGGNGSSGGSGFDFNNAIQLLGAGLSAYSGFQGSKSAGESSEQAAALQQQALGLANPASAQAGRENFNQGVNNQVAGNFLGDQDLGPTSGFRDISGGNNFQFNDPNQGRQLQTFQQQFKVKIKAERM